MIVTFNLAVTGVVVLGLDWGDSTGGTLVCQIGLCDKNVLVGLFQANYLIKTTLYGFIYSLNSDSKCCTMVIVNVKMQIGSQPVLYVLCFFNVKNALLYI